MSHSSATAWRRVSTLRLRAPLMAGLSLTLPRDFDGTEVEGRVVRATTGVSATRAHADP